MAHRLRGADVHDHGAVVARPRGSCRCGAGRRGRARPVSVSTGSPARSPTVAHARTGRAARRSQDRPPTARATGNGCMNATSCPASITTTPADRTKTRWLAVGFAFLRREFGDELAGGDPDRAASARFGRPPLRKERPRSSGVTWHLVAPVMSTNASSSEIGSTSGDTSRRIAISWELISS